MYKYKSIKELRDIIDEENNAVEIFNFSKDLAHKYQDKYNSFVTILDNCNYKKTNSILSGISYSLKDNYSTKGILTTASSNILKDYIPVIDSTVYKKLKESGALLVGKTVLDELAMGGSGTTGHTGIVKNPWDINRQVGGSSAGSASSVALGIVPFSVGSDTGDSVRKPASFAGLVGFKPTYGRISRYGLFAFASSLDHVAILSRNVDDSAIVTDVLKGRDINDLTTLKDDNITYYENIDSSIKNKKLCYIKEICGMDIIKDSSDKELIKTIEDFHKLLDKLKDNGFIIEEVSIDKSLLEAIYPTYMCISCAEATSNNANLTGISFGPRADGDNVNEMIFNARSLGFSELIKRRFILGSYILQKENQEKLFLNAKRVRRLIVDNMNELFKTYSGMIAPCSGGAAPLFDSVSEKLSDRYLILENHLAIGNFGGYPSITLPYTLVNDLPVGVNITGAVLDDLEVLKIAKKVEEVTGYKNLHRKDDLDV